MQERLRHGQTEILTLIGKDIDHGAVHRGVDRTLIQPRTGRIKVCRRGIAQRFGAADIFLARAGTEQRESRARLRELSGRNPRITLDFENVSGGDGDALFEFLGSIERLLGFLGTRL